MPLAAFDANTVRTDVHELCDKLEDQFRLFRDGQLNFYEVEKRFNAEYGPQAISYMEIFKKQKLVTPDEESVIRCRFSEHTAAAVLQKVPELLRRIVSRLAL